MSKKVKRILAKLNDKRLRDNILESLNRDTLDEAETVAGGEQEVKVLKEMNEFEDFREI